MTSQTFFSYHCVEYIKIQQKSPCQIGLKNFNVILSLLSKYVMCFILSQWWSLHFPRKTACSVNTSNTYQLRVVSNRYFVIVSTWRSGYKYKRHSNTLSYYHIIQSFILAMYNVTETNVTEGDMILENKEMDKKKDHSRQRRAALKDPSLLWPDGVVPYDFHYYASMRKYP